MENEESKNVSLSEPPRRPGSLSMTKLDNT